MGRRLLSHLLITLAVFSLTATFFIWVLDATILNPTNLTKALQQGGVPSAIASIIPEQASKGETNNNNCDQSKPQNGCQPKAETAQDIQESADMKNKIAAVVTPDYVNQKIDALSVTVITYLKQGSPSPVLDLSDFPAKLRASGVDTGGDIEKSFSKPIELNNNGSLKVLPKAYKILKIAKYLGALLFVLLLVAEWFVAVKGDRLHRIGRIFLHAGMWYTLWWVCLVFLPSHLLPKLKGNNPSDESISTLMNAVTKSVQHLFSLYFLGFAIVCWVIALTLYLVRHFRKHVDKIQAVPAAKPAKSNAVPNKR